MAEGIVDVEQGADDPGHRRAVVDVDAAGLVDEQAQDRPGSRTCDLGLDQLVTFVRQDRLDEGGDVVRDFVTFYNDLPDEIRKAIEDGEKRPTNHTIFGTDDLDSDTVKIFQQSYEKENGIRNLAKGKN